MSGWWVRPTPDPDFRRQSANLRGLERHAAEALYDVVEQDHRFPRSRRAAAMRRLCDLAHRLHKELAKAAPRCHVPRCPRKGLKTGHPRLFTCSRHRPSK